VRSGNTEERPQQTVILKREAPEHLEPERFVYEVEFRENSRFLRRMVAGVVGASFGFILLHSVGLITLPAIAIEPMSVTIPVSVLVLFGELLLNHWRTR
jgi:hypothetical protein